jgi:flagellar biosynthesis protein FlhF
MKLKRFFASDMRQALRLVREEQGPDAVILSNQRVDGGIEIIAAVDYDPVLAQHMLAGSAAPAHSGRARADESAATAQQESGRDACGREPFPVDRKGDAAACGTDRRA